jgi:hypothetical protein
MWVADNVEEKVNKHNMKRIATSSGSVDLESRISGAGSPESHYQKTALGRT